MKKIILLSLVVIMFSSCDLIVSAVDSIKTINRETKKQEEVKKENQVIYKQPKNGVKKYKYDNGNIKSIVTFKDGKKVGVSNTFYKSGEKQYDIPYQDGKKHGKVIWYYKSGKVYRETDYKLGKKDGYQRKYWESGNLKSEMVYKDNMFSKGLKEINNSNKVKSTPKILVDEIDRVKTTGEYILRFSLSNDRKKVVYYIGELVEGKYFPADGKGFMELPSKNGIAEYKFKVGKGTQLIKNVKLVAIESTSYKNKRVLSVSVPISVRNPQ
ncbi:toxin-antitoxin system YwqK family antitoxin [Marinifilum flexuosum]|uniref:toxin-antitoxin system YwqK family antitoxin n=1 Tax=Marinifilum flexuosum TaxID=1117708 RepID=UPI002491E6C8|nr:hypothetical protein [Marinifilum flexuosum]